MAQTIIADPSHIHENPLGLATLINVYGLLYDGREFAAIMYTTVCDLRKACFQKTYYLDHRVQMFHGTRVRFAEYTFNEQFKIGAQAAREAKFMAIEGLREMLPKAVIMHSDYASLS